MARAEAARRSEREVHATTPPTFAAAAPAAPPALPAPEAAAPPPMVFQCKHCLTVVGDSFSWVKGHRDLSLIVLSAASSQVSVDERHTTSDTTLAASGTCIFTPLVCVSCASQLGRMYLETPPVLADLQGLYALYHDALVVYVVRLTQLPTGRHSL